LRMVRLGWQQTPADSAPALQCSYSDVCVSQRGRHHRPGNRRCHADRSSSGL